jgi:hypothetical protein
MGGTPIAWWFIVENPIFMADLGVLPFMESLIYSYDYQSCSSLFDLFISPIFLPVFGVLGAPLTGGWAYSSGLLHIVVIYTPWGSLIESLHITPYAPCISHILEYIRDY